MTPQNIISSFHLGVVIFITKLSLVFLRLWREKTHSPRIYVWTRIQSHTAILSHRSQSVWAFLFQFYVAQTHRSTWSTPVDRLLDPKLCLTIKKICVHQLNHHNTWNRICPLCIRLTTERVTILQWSTEYPLRNQNHRHQNDIESNKIDIVKKNESENKIKLSKKRCHSNAKLYEMASVRVLAYF